MTKAKLYFTDTDSQEINDLEVTNLSASGIITATQFSGSFIGISTLSVGYADTAGISTTSQGLTGTPNITVGIVTAAAYVATGTTAVYAGGVGVSTVNSNTTAFHYITYDSNLSGVDISNFTPGKKFEIIARNTTGNNRTVVIKTSTTTTGHTAVPVIIGAPSGTTVTNGTFTLNSEGVHINVFNMNGTVVGSICGAV